MTILESIGESVARAIISFPGVVTFCTAILLWAWCAYRRLQHRLIPFVEELERFCKVLDGIKDEAEFAKRIEEIDEQVRGSKLLGHPWSEFRKTLIYPSLDEDAPVLFNSHSAAAFFSRENLLGEHLNLRFYNALPNLFTGAGILGTFIGLVAGIGLAGSSLADPDKAQAALSDLLSGASLAFLTSIFGLAASIGFSYREKHWLHRFEQLRQRWVSGLERRLRRITLEELARNMLDESRRQTDYFSQFAEQLAFQLADALERTVPKALDEKVTAPLTAALESLQRSVEDLARNQQRTNEETLREIVERFSETISGAAGTEMQAFARTVKALSEQVNNQIEEVARQQEAVRRQSEESVKTLAATFQQGAEGLQNKVKDSVDQILSGLSTTVEEMSSVLSDTVNRMSGELEQTATAFAQAAGGLVGSVESIRGILTDTRELVEYLDQLIATARKAHTELVRVAGGIGEASRATEAAAAKIAQAAGTTQDATAALETALQKFAHHQATLERIWTQYEERFAGLDASLSDVFQQIEHGLERYAQQVKEFITDLDRHTGEITSMLAGAVQELNESVEELSDTLAGRSE